MLSLGKLVKQSCRTVSVLEEVIVYILTSINIVVIFIVTVVFLLVLSLKLIKLLLPNFLIKSRFFIWIMRLSLSWLLAKFHSQLQRGKFDILRFTAEYARAFINFNERVANCSIVKQLVLDICIVIIFDRFVCFTGLMGHSAVSSGLFWALCRRLYVIEGDLARVTEAQSLVACRALYCLLWWRAGRAFEPLR